MGAIDQKALNRHDNIQIAARTTMAARISDKSESGIECDSENPVIQNFQLLMLKRKETAVRLLASSHPEEKKYLSDHFDLYQHNIKQLLGLLDEPEKSE